MNLTNILGAITVITTTNLMEVDFRPIACRHPGCGEWHEYHAIERYVLVRKTWAAVEGSVPPSQVLLHSTTNDYRAVTNTVESPAVYQMHTRPGEIYEGNRMSVRKDLGRPPLPGPVPTPRAQLVNLPRRGNTTNLPSDLLPSPLPRGTARPRPIELKLSPP